MKKNTSINETKLSYINFAILPEKNILSKNQSEIVNFINKRYSQGILTTITDLSQFVNSNKNNNKAAHKLASRICLTGAIESINGIYVPKGSGEYLDKVNIKFLSKIKTKREKNKIFKSKQHIIELIRPFITQNRWCLPSTHLTAQFQINKIFHQLTNLKIFKLDNNRLVIPSEYNNLFPDLKITFNVYPNDRVIVQIGNKQNLIQANGSIVCSALWICHNYLIKAIQFCNLGLEIPSYSNWTISIPYIYSKTLYEYTKLNGKLQDDDLGLKLTDEKTHLLLTSKPPRTKLKPKQLHYFLIKFNPLTKFVTSTMFGNDEGNVTKCKNFEKSPKIMEKINEY